MTEIGNNSTSDWKLVKMVNLSTNFSTASAIPSDVVIRGAHLNFSQIPKSSCNQLFFIIHSRIVI